MGYVGRVVESGRLTGDTRGIDPWQEPIFGGTDLRNLVPNFWNFCIVTTPNEINRI